MVGVKSGSCVLWGAGVFFLMSHGVVRTLLNALALPIRADLHLSPAEFGLIASAFYVGYSLIQFCSGALMDHIGPLKVFLVSVPLHAIMSLFFVYVGFWDSALFYLVICRGFSGFTGATAFIGVTKLTGAQIPQEKFRPYYSFAYILFMCMRPLTLFLVMVFQDQISWKEFFLLSTLLDLCVWIVMFSFRKHSMNHYQPFSWRFLNLSTFRKSMRSEIIFVSLGTAALLSPLYVFSDNWGVSFFFEGCGMYRNDAANVSILLSVTSFLSACIEPQFAHVDFTKKALFAAIVSFLGIAGCTMLSTQPHYYIVLMAVLIGSSGVLLVSLICAIVALAPKGREGVCMSVSCMVMMITVALYIFLYGWIIGAQTFGSEVKVIASHQYIYSNMFLMMLVVCGIMLLIFAEKRYKINAKINIKNRHASGSLP
ncbi:MAG: MFS transporter [Alphaproteobacteria bacterium]|nr:MFS transporter [Alphaproteobacteria bacterium]